MKIIESIHNMQSAAAASRRAGKTIGFVPTMGYLHRGHTSLMDIARESCDVLVASIFVNPTQFAPNEDLDAYPRDFERDEKICREHGVDILFYPHADEMYLPDSSVYVVEQELSQGLCGRSRPTHFRGVCTVVAKLLNIVSPDFIVLGQKDYQQLAVLRRMVRDLNFPFAVRSGPIVREPDGLALSSRNRYLTADQRSDARCLRAALDLAERLYSQGVNDAAQIEKEMRGLIDSTTSATIDYIEIVDAENLAPVKQIEHPTLIALAVFIGKTRLIDNTVLAERARNT